MCAPRRPWPGPRSPILRALLPSNTSLTSQAAGASASPSAAGLGVWPRGGADRFAIDEKIDAGLALPSAASDQERDELSGNLEFRRRQRPRRLVAAEHAVHQSVASETGDGFLMRERALRGAGTEGVPGGLPGSVIGSLEIREDDITVVVPRAARRRPRTSATMAAQTPASKRFQVGRSHAMAHYGRRVGVTRRI